ncbi:hypothetical protein BJP40_06410 [Streptomyces sp. CC53]|uniref:hypothetical protein n=1 Tax=Streptomyces sp. CC53 TaxID=1906740 RepID=UPI0008DE8673|nr:hypothetical protein [Streptomyces sp. CC53]OII61155.1 hypothetical protein BJP40_06410 [Streptomyces sp. CC53]
MGTDIHGVLQSRYRDGQSWYTECRMEDGRNYRLFAALADVRNGFGFARVPTHTPITPIAEPRGWPDDFSLKQVRWILGYGDDEDEAWLGDHSFSWLGLDEVADWKGWDQELKECGYISREEYESWDPVFPPAGGWCGGIYGRDVVAIDQRSDADLLATKDWTHVRVYWSRPLRESCTAFLAWVEYARAKTAGQEARIVFGFDS